MKTYLVHHTPKSPEQDTWAVSFSLPYIASTYARAGDGIWYVKTWLTAGQIKKRLAVLFDDCDQLLIQELGRDVALLNSRINWMPGRLDDDEPVSAALPLFDGPRAAWAAFQQIVAEISEPVTAGSSLAKSEHLRAA